MSNLCSNYVTVTGDKIAIDELATMIGQVGQLSRKDLTVDNWLLCDAPTLHVDYGLCNYQRNVDGEVTLTICSRNAEPRKELLALSLLHPTLTFVTVYEEPMCEVYGRLEITGGSTVEDQGYTEEEYLELYDEDYKIEKKCIAESSYEDFLKEYTEWDCYDEPKYTALGKDIIDRIRDEDLPLFINVDWLIDSITKKFKTRFSPSQEATDEQE